MTSHKYGLKVWSSNTQYEKSIIDLFQQKIFHYIEIYTLPNTYNSFSSFWLKLKKNYGIPFIVHAPHSAHSMNLALPECQETNLILWKEVEKWSSLLEPQYIIFHSGIFGTISETLKQLQLINCHKIIIENKPLVGLGGEHCIGATFNEFQFIKNNTEIEFCFDFGHAICAANAQKLNPNEEIKKFLELNPVMFHLSDGEFSSIRDQHRHFGEGDFPLSSMLKMLPEKSMISIETQKDSSENLDDFKKDIFFLHEVLKLV